MKYPKHYEDDIDSLKKDFGLTDEEIEGFLEFFDAFKEENKRVINIGPKEDR